MRIYTKTGDQGTTALFSGKRVVKHHVRIEAYGTVDELNAYVGMLGDLPVNTARQGFLRAVQGHLFTMGAMLAAPGEQKATTTRLPTTAIQQIEKEIDALDSRLPALKTFILPGGHPAVSYGHIARTICRRAERGVTRLFETEPGDVQIVAYLNRLADYLFVLSRAMAMELDVAEVPWIPNH